MYVKKAPFLTILAILFSSTVTFARKLDENYDNYYQSIDSSAQDDELKSQLQALISVHTVIDYDTAWEAFAAIDKYLPTYPCSSNATNISDIYSSYCWKVQKDVIGGECGNYKKEGDCYNREHIWPKSWFGGFDEGENAQTDLFELWPTDGYVNGLRGNLPLGDVVPSTIKYNSTNGCLIGKCSSTDASYTGDCFQVASLYQGDVSRSYFYLATAYWNAWSCCDEPGVNGSDVKPWMENQLRTWHQRDPVDESEQRRNDEIYANWQGNRNPFIDHPEWVDQISNF